MDILLKKKKERKERKRGKREKPAQFLPQFHEKENIITDLLYY